MSDRARVLLIAAAVILALLFLDGPCYSGGFSDDVCHNPAGCVGGVNQ